MSLSTDGVATGQARALRALVEGTTHLVCLLSATAEIAYVSPSVTRVLGYPPEELVGRSLADLLHPDDVPAAAALFEANANAPASGLIGRDDLDTPSEWRLRHADGRFVTVEALGNNFLADPDIAGILVIAQDRTARREYEEALQALARSSVDEPGYVRLLDLIDAQLTGVSSALYIAGRWPEWVQHGVHAELCPPAGVGPWYTAIESGENVIVEDFDGAVAAEMMSEELAYVARRANYLACWCIVIPTPRADLPSLPQGEPLGCLVIWSSRYLRPLFGDEHTLVRAAALAELALARRTTELELRWEAAHDDLTQALNRGGLLSSIRLSGRPGAFLLVDFDGFQEVNDTHGHSAGDDVLRALAERLRNAVRGDDLVGRIGGDEFAIFLPDATTRSATAAADRLVEVFLHPLAVGGEEFNISISIGVDCSQSVSLEEQIDRADRSLRVAKRAGRGRIAIWAEENGEE